MNSVRPLLEVISTSPTDSQTLSDSGADRIELVSALEIGGVSPSRALLRRSLEAASIPTVVMVRHHNQGFIHPQHQEKLLIEEAVDLVESGAKGLVIGAITQHRTVDEKFLQSLREQIPNKVELTFHKASDQLADLPGSYPILKKHGITRVLTQGGKASILENKGVLAEVIAKGEVSTLLGGGINIDNVTSIVKELNPREIHVGTCVRVEKYGEVSGEKVREFLAKVGSI